MKFHITVPESPIFPVAGMLRTIQDHCANLRSLGYDATATEHEVDGKAGVWIKVYKGGTCLIDETHPLDTDYTAEFSRFAGKAHFQFILDRNAERITAMGGTIVPGDDDQLVGLEWEGEESQRFFTTYGDVPAFLDYLDRREVNWLMGKAANLFTAVGWKRGAATDAFVWIKSDGRKFDTVALNDPADARELIKEAEKELAAQEAAKIAAESNPDGTEPNAP